MGQSGHVFRKGEYLGLAPVRADDRSSVCFRSYPPGVTVERGIIGASINPFSVPGRYLLSTGIGGRAAVLGLIGSVRHDNRPTLCDEELCLRGGRLEDVTHPPSFEVHAVDAVCELARQPHFHRAFAVLGAMCRPEVVASHTNDLHTQETCETLLLEW